MYCLNKCCANWCCGLSSALEHAVPEQMFVNETNPGEAISAVKALQKANAAGQRIYQVTQANQGTTLANVHHDSATMDEIRNALIAGKEVITPTDAVGVPGWSGAGYIIFDPEIGDGAYKIGGGNNGGYQQSHKAIWWAGFIQGTGLAVILLIATSLAAIASGAIWVIWAAIALIVIANVVQMYTNLEKYGGDAKWASCYLGGVMTGLGLTGVANLQALVGQLLTVISIYMGFAVDTTYYDGC